MNAPGIVGIVPYVVSGDALVREQERSAAMREALRRIAHKADYSLGRSYQPFVVTDLQEIRALALNAIADNKE